MSINWTAIGVVLAILIALFQGAKFVFGKLVKFGEIANRLNTVEKHVKDIRDDTKDLNKDISSILKMLAEKGLAKSNSPRTLTRDGQRALVKSGISGIVDDKFDYIVKRVAKTKPENPYQAEQAVLDVVSEFKKNATLKDAIEEGAFISGYFVDSVLFVGGLYIRDKVLKELGFDVSEIDSHIPHEGA